MQLLNAVGQSAKNNMVDVKIVQDLLSQNMLQLVPARSVESNGVCDDQTIYLIKLFQERVVGLQYPTGVVFPQSPTWFALNGQSGPGAKELDPETVVDALQSDFVNFAQRFIKDNRVRENYVAEAKEFSQEILDEYANGDVTAAEAASKANAMRNSLMDASRLNNSDIGRAVSEAEKAAGKTIEELMEHYATKIHGRPFAELSAAEQDTVFLEIVKAAGRPNPKWTARAAVLGKVGKGLLIVSIAIAAYNIASSDRPGRQAVKEGSTLGIGFLGSVAGGAVAGFACGPGAPVCVGVGALIGGIAFAVGADLTFDWLWN
jgi:hypothetical protein